MDFVIYILQSSLCLGLFYGFYCLVLRQEKGFKANRFYLLLTLLGSFMIPLVTIPIDVLIEVTTPVEPVVVDDIRLDDIPVVEETLTFLERLKVTLPRVLWSVLLLGAMIRGAVFMRHLWMLRRLIEGGEVEKKDGIAHVYNPEIDAIFSFWNVIYWSGQLPHHRDVERILQHEMAHIRQYHSVDVMICELLKIPFWFNPLIYWYKNSLQQVHEYLADEAVVKKEGRVVEYANLLVQQAKKYTRVYSISNSFFQKPIKNRLIMLNRPKQVLWHSMKMMSMAPIVLGLCYSLCVEYQYVGIPIEKESTEYTFEQNDGKKMPEIVNEPLVSTNEKKEEKVLEVPAAINEAESPELVQTIVRAAGQPVDLLKRDGIYLLKNTSSLDSTKIPETKVVLEQKPKLDLFRKPKNPPVNPKKGSCYAKCMMPDKVATTTAYVPVYTGGGNDDVATKVIEVESEAASTKWVKKKDDKNCMSKDPKDCLVWCLTEVPAKKESLKVVVDTELTDKFVMKQVVLSSEIVSKGGDEWQEVVCADKITTKLISSLQQKLNAKGVSLKVTGKFDKATKEAMVAFQTKANLPSGNLTIATLEALGIKS